VKDYGMSNVLNTKAFIKRITVMALSTDLIIGTSA